jgi:hypothetical protein
MHFDFGISSVEPGAVPVATLFRRGVVVDVELHAGGLVAGSVPGILAADGVPTARARPSRTSSTRAVHGWLESGRYEPLRTSATGVGLPIAAIALRLTAAGTFENLDAPFIQTAKAIGTPRRRLLAAAVRPTDGATAADLAEQVRQLVFNLILVECVFFLPGFLWFTKRATGNDPPRYIVPDVNTLAGVAIWSAVLIVTLSLLADVLAVILDPRVSMRP